MDKAVVNKANEIVALICRKNDNHNNTYILVPEQVSLGRITDSGYFQSENGEFNIPAFDKPGVMSDPAIEYVYALSISLSEIQTKNPNINELGILLSLYLKEIASDLLLVVSDDNKTKLYKTSYKNVSEEITGSLSKKIEEKTHDKPEEEPKLININTNEKNNTGNSINLYNLEKYVKERVLYNDSIVEDICTTIALNYSATNAKEVESILSIGETGTGKTETFRVISEYIGIPLIIYDCNTLTSTGYVGKDIEDVLREILLQSNGNVNVAERSIILFDEIDKLAAKGNHVTDVGPQELLLKFYDGSTYSFEQYKNGPKINMSTSFITKAASGAFPSIFEKRRKSNSIGFTNNTKSSYLTDPITSQELVKFGMLKELVGRWYNRFVYQPHTEESLSTILVQSKNSPLLLKQERYLREFNCELSWDESFIKAFAHLALQDDIGARCLNSLLAKTFKKVDRELKTELDLSGKNIKRKVLVDESIIHNPSSFEI